MTNCREATFPENTGKILNVSGGEGKRQKISGLLIFPAKITDTYKYALKALPFRKPGESANFLHSFEKMTIHYSIAFKPLVLLLFSPKKEAARGYTQTLLLPSND